LNTTAARIAYFAGRALGARSCDASPPRAAIPDRHPNVTTCRRSEIDRLYRGVVRFSPEEWDRFRAGVPEAERDGNILAAHARLMESPDAGVRRQAADDWLAWEDAVTARELARAPGPTPASWSRTAI
jgi:hypothetical protein